MIPNSMCKKLTGDVPIAIVKIAGNDASSSKPDELRDIHTVRCSVGYVSF